MEIDLELLKPMLRVGDLEGAARFLANCGTPLEVVTACHTAGKNMYWKENDIAAAVSALGAGIRFALDFAESADSEEVIELLGKAKAMNFDLGSFCWPGWEEPGIVIDGPLIDKGRAAAAENLRLAIELERGPFPMGNAHWLVGAYHLVDRNWPAALDSLGRSVEFAGRRTDLDFMSLMACYVALAAYLGGDASAQSSFGVTADRLSGPLRQQADAAWRYFTSER